MAQLSSEIATSHFAPRQRSSLDFVLTRTSERTSERLLNYTTNYTELLHHHYSLTSDTSFTKVIHQPPKINVRVLTLLQKSINHPKTLENSHFTMAPAPAFRRFAQLPRELQHQIWRHAMYDDAQNLRLMVVPGLNPLTRQVIVRPVGPMSPLLSVNADSRHLALRLYYSPYSNNANGYIRVVAVGRL